MIQISPDITLDASEFEFSFIRASGPGGQNVNKVATAVQLRFNVVGSPSLPEELKTRLLARAGRRATRDGVIVIEAKRYRLQARNKEDAINRLVALITDAKKVRTPRRTTKPPRSAAHKRVEDKKVRGRLKQSRRPPRRED